VEQVRPDCERTRRHVQFDRNRDESEGDDALTRSHVHLPYLGQLRVLDEEAAAPFDTGQRPISVPNGAVSNYMDKAAVSNYMDKAAETEDYRDDESTHPVFVRWR